MMRRLIDADKCPCVVCEDTRNAHCTYEHRSCKKFCDWLNNTAYDTERVVEQLERKKEQCEKDRSYWAERSAVDSCIYNECDLFGSKADLLEETIEIVRKGGAE